MRKKELAKRRARPEKKRSEKNGRERAAAAAAGLYTYMAERRPILFCSANAKSRKIERERERESPAPFTIRYIAACVLYDVSREQTRKRIRTSSA